MNTKTPKAPKGAAETPLEAFNFPTQAFEFPAALREVAEKSVSQARDAYARMRTAAEDATDLVEGTIETAREGAFALSVKALDAAKSNSDASFAFARDLVGAKTISDIIELQSTFARNQFEAVTGQFKELQELSQKLLTDTAKPMTERVEKTFNEMNAA